MSEDDAIKRQVGEIFIAHIHSDKSLDDIMALDTVLPDDRKVLRGLGARCLEEARKALRAGHHMEGRRLDILGRQLQQRAGKADLS